jgi:hypothetical protein
MKIRVHVLQVGQLEGGVGCAFGGVAAGRRERGQAAREAVRIRITLHRRGIIRGRRRDEKREECEEGKKSNSESLHRVNFFSLLKSRCGDCLDTEGQWTRKERKKKTKDGDNTRDARGIVRESKR